MSSTYFLNWIKKRIFTHKGLRYLKTSIPKKVLKISQFSFFTVYRVRGAVVGGNFSPIGEYPSTVKNRRK